MEEELEETSLRHRTAASRHQHHQRRRAKKPPPQTTNYDDVFGGPPRHAVPFSGVPDDYAEVFGGVSVSCSIPFLDLPTGQMDGWDCASGENMNGVEYGEIFGRCDFSDFAVPYEELFGRGESDEGERDMHFASANGRSSVKGRSGPQTTDPSAFIQEYSNEDSIPYLEDENFSVASDETPKEYNTSYNKSSRTRAHELLHTIASVPQPQTGFTFVIEPNNPLPEHLVVSEDTVTDESSVKPNPKSSLNSQSISSKEQVSHGVPFLDVADVNLLTRSANLPPPAPKTSINERQRINTLQKSVSVLNFSTEAEQPPLTQQEKPKTILKSDSLPPNFDFVPNLKLDRREKPKLKSRPKTFLKSESLPPGFGSELDAMKEAMEFAQARLKTAKELHEKKREGKITELPLKKKHVKEENLENSEGEKPRVLRSISLASNFSKSREFMKLQGGVAATQGTRELEKSGKWRSDEEFHELTSIDQPTKERENKVGMTGTEPLVETNRESVQIDGLPSTEAGLTGNYNADMNDTENLQLAGKITGDDDTEASKEDANVILKGEDIENTGEVEEETEGGKGFEMKVGVEIEEEDIMKLDEETKRQRESEELEKERQREKEIEEKEEKERACKLEEEKERALQLEDEKERARKLEEENERKLQMEKGREEKERRERERIMAEEEERLERERMKKWEEEESERERLEKEREEKQRMLAEERERERKLEEDRQEEKMKEKEMVRKLEEEKERERKLEEEIEKERVRVRKLEEEMEQERERVKKLEEEKQREREMARKLEKEKERGRKLEEEVEKDREKDRQRIRKLEEEREWERERVRQLEEERELEREKVRKLEEEREEERERVRKLEEEREKERIERERERKEREKIEQEREQKERERIVKEREQKEMEKKLEEEKEKQRMEKEKEEREKLRRMEKEREEKEMAMRLEAETRRLERERAEEKDKMTKLHGEKTKERKTEARKSDDERERERRVKERERKTEGRKSDEDRRKSDEERERERDRRARKGRQIEEREREREEEERKREREKDRLAMERATQERAERIAIERITAARQRAVENREKEEMNSRGGSGEGFEKRRPKGEEEKKEREGERNAREARLRAERAAVERATAEARERAIEKAKADVEKERDRLERYKSFNKISSQDHAQEAHFKRTQSDSALSQHGHGESALRHKARLERQQRTAERAAKALAEKNRRDIMAQREQSERDRIAEHLDAEVKRWSSGKEGNLRALLSTLQYILGQNSGWQSIHLTEVITAADVKKAYRKATLYVHPDKLQQRGASIHQKYICEKVFDLLKEAWNKFNSEER